MNIKTFLPYIIIIILGVIIFLSRGCNDKEEIIIKVPEVSGEFEPQKPVYITRTDTVYITKWRNIEVKTKNPVNDSLAIAYQHAKDSLDRYKMFLDAIQIRNFSNTFDDEFLNLTISGSVQGELLSIKPNYTIKEREVPVEVPQTRFRLLAGGEIGSKAGLDQFPIKAGIGLQNTKGDILRASVMQLSGETYYLAGYDFSIINFKK